MTLIVTQISKHGIVHATDSNLSDSVGSFVQTGEKLIPIPKIHSAITIAGDYSIGSTTINQWISKIIESNDYKNLNEFAHLLKNKLDDVTEEYYAMFHLSGYVKENLNFHPEFWFIRNIEIDQTGEYNIKHSEFIVEEQFWSNETNQFLYSLFKEDKFAYQLYINGYTNGRIGFNKARYYIEQFYKDVWEDSSNQFRPPKNIIEVKLLIKNYFQIINLLFNLSNYEGAPIGGQTQLLVIENPETTS